MKLNQKTPIPTLSSSIKYKNLLLHHLKHVRDAHGDLSSSPPFLLEVY
jgi:hypothetical protein